MSATDASTPLVFLIRHGETTWSKSGRYTSTTDLDLTSEGIDQVNRMALLHVGHDRIINPNHVAHAWISPRKRASLTFDLLFDGYDSTQTDARKVTVTEEIAEWAYGEYEGLLESEIRERRKQNGLDGEREWDIWRDGCEGGESTAQVTERLDGLISEIRDLQRPWFDGKTNAKNIVLVAHGLILRAFTKRWVNIPIESPLPIMMAPGAIAILSYKKRDINKPALYIGLPPPLKTFSGLGAL